MPKPRDKECGTRCARMKHKGRPTHPCIKQEPLTLDSRDDINHSSTTLSLFADYYLLFSSKRHRAQHYPSQNRPKLQTTNYKQTTDHNNEALPPCHHHFPACVRWDGGPSTCGLFSPIFKSHIFCRSVRRGCEPRGLANLEYRTNVLRVRLCWERQRVVDWLSRL